MTVSALALGMSIGTKPYEARAQGVSSEQTSQSSKIEEVVVTGSRVVSNGYEAPTPVTIVGVEQLQQAGLPNIADVVTQIPSFTHDNSPHVGGNEVALGQQGQYNLSLRGLGISRSLVLLDGHRIVSGATSGAVNVNDFPQALVSRIDVVTGGASAVYGSDAVGGVANFILDKQFVGVKGEAGGGVTTYGDDRSANLSLSSGFTFSGEKGHVLLSAEYSNLDGLFPVKYRDWPKNMPSIILNPTYAAGNGQPQYLLRTQAVSILEAPGGIITSGPLKGTTFGPNGTPFQIIYGSLTGTQSTVGGPYWEYLNSGLEGQSLDDHLFRYNFFGRSSYQISDDVNVFFEFIHSFSSSYANSKLADSVNNITISAGNPFIPSSVATQMAQLNLATLTMGSFNLDLPHAGSTNTRRIYSYSGGADGKAAAFDTEWSWDVYLQHGVAPSSINGHAINLVNLNLARDAVRAPNGNIVCRSSLTNPNNGCIPFNSFGWGVNTAAAVKYVFGDSHLSQTIKEDVATFGVRGEPFDAWAGPVSVASGIEYRREAVRGVSDAASMATQWSTGNYKPANGSYSVTEGYVETQVPIVRGARWAQDLAFNAAMRATSYTTSGLVTTWKMGMVYQPFDDIRFRATQSHDIRAPNLGELYAGGTFGQGGSLLDPFTNATIPPPVQPYSGNPNLLPERANTTELGVVLQPGFFPGFSLSTDYYRISVNDQIVQQRGGQDTLNRCFTGQQVYCSQIVRNAAGQVVQISTTNINLSRIDQRGMDIAANYHVRLDTISPSWSGELSLRGSMTYMFQDVIDDLLNPPQDWRDSVTVIVAQKPPSKWRLLLGASYSNDPVTIGWTGRGVSAGNFGPNYLQCSSNCPTSTPIAQTIDVDRVPGAFYHDLSASYKLARKSDGPADIEVFLSIQNVLNTQPGYRSFELYDVLGRVFHGGVRFKM